MSRTVSILDIYLNRSLVGALLKTVSGETSFTYDETWLGRPDRMPISLSLPLGRKPQKGAAVMAYFDNLLPDNDEIRKRIAEREGAVSTRPFDLLAAIGRDCVGALRFLPRGGVPDLSPAMDSTEVSAAEIARRLHRLKSAPLGRDLDDGDTFRLSLAGAQDKTAFLRLPSGAWAIPQGLTATSHIFKPPIGMTDGGQLDLSDSVENEWMSLAFCRAFGLTVAEATMERFEDAKALVVRRFDRKTLDNVLYRLPQEDLCQALGISGSQKYEDRDGPGMVRILKFLASSDSPDKDRRDFLRAQMIYWALSATDGHAKNFSIFLTPGGFSLTPIYDVMTSLPYAGHSRSFDPLRVKLAMAVGNNRHYRMRDIEPQHWRQTGAAAGLPKGMVEAVMADLAARASQAVDEVAQILPAGFPIPMFEATKRIVLERAGKLGSRSSR